MTDHPISDPREPRSGSASDDESTQDLLARARLGDANALNALLTKITPALTRWAHGRLPRYARSMTDTMDLVQESIAAVSRRIDTMNVRHEGALQTYLRKTVENRIRDEVRRVQRREPATSSDPADRVSDHSVAV
jgi:RNA polymerase sigma-70 factor (ECF subfamily)